MSELHFAKAPSTPEYVSNTYLLPPFIFTYKENPIGGIRN